MAHGTWAEMVAPLPARVTAVINTSSVPLRSFELAQICHLWRQVEESDVGWRISDPSMLMRVLLHETGETIVTSWLPTLQRQQFAPHHVSNSISTCILCSCSWILKTSPSRSRRRRRVLQGGNNTGGGLTKPSARCLLCRLTNASSLHKSHRRRCSPNIIIKGRHPGSHVGYMAL